MKQAFLIFTIAALLFSLSSCSTYVDGTGYAGVRPRSSGYHYRAPAPRPQYYSGTRYYDHHDHSSHYKSKAKPTPPGHWKHSGVKAKTNSNVRLRPLNVSNSMGLRLF